MRLKSFSITFISFACSLLAYGQQYEKPAEDASKQDSVAVRSGSERGAGAKGYWGGNDLYDMHVKKDIFYSDAPMYVAPTDEEDKPSIFIMGNATFGNDAEIKQKGITSLTGDVVSLKHVVKHGTPQEVFPKSLFVDPDEVGTIRFSGVWNTQNIMRGEIEDELDFFHFKMLSEGYVLNFPRIEVVKEGILKISDVPTDKPITDPAGIKPEYDLKTMGYVNVATNVAMSAQLLDITGGNRFSVDVYSSGIDPLDYWNSVHGKDESFYQLNSGYADINKIHSDNGESGHSEVNMQLYNYTAGVDDAQGDSKVSETNTFGISLTDLTRATYMRGFTSPFEKLRTDYMLYHVLTKPNYFSVTSGEGPIAPPDMLLTPGQGYFHAMDVSRQKFEEIDENWKVKPEFRARGGYRLSRVINEVVNKDNKMNLFSFDKDNSNYEEQRFNTDDVTVKLYANKHPNGDKKETFGLNFLANPYMTPISMTGVLGDISTGKSLEDAVAGLTDFDSNDASTPFNIGFTGNTGSLSNVKAVHVLGNSSNSTQKLIQDAVNGSYALVRSAYWVVNSAFIANTKTQGKDAYAYNVKYDLVDIVTQPGTIDDVEDRFLEPMQMFLLQVASPGEFTFSPKLKAKKGTRFGMSLSLDDLDLDPIPESRNLRSVASNEESTGYTVPDWFVIEAVAGSKKFTTDRTAVRFFDRATIGFDSDHDHLKKLTQDKVAFEKQKRTGRIGEDMGEDFVPTNVVYTKTPQGEALLGNAINYKTKEIPLHYIPSNEKESVTFSVYGLEGVEGVKGVWLIDKDKNNYKQDLLQDNSYTFDSYPVKNPLQAENRFILRFYDDGDDDNGPTLTEKPITCYYSGSTLHIGGLNEKDLGSSVQIFDLQGRMMGNTKVTNYPSMEYQKTLGQGTFIVKITGERNYTTKFVNIQNY